MKHLKLYENKQKTLWLLDYYIIKGSDHSYRLYPDRESAENMAIEIINDERDQLENEDYDEYNYFTDYETAMKWYENTFNDIIITIDEVKVSDKYEGSEKFKLKKAAKQYNL